MPVKRVIHASLPGLICFSLALVIGMDSGLAATTRDITVQPEQRPLVEMEVPESDLDVTAWVNRSDHTYRPGDTVTLYVKTSEPAYLYVIDHGTSGKIHLIYPNRYQKRHKVPAHRVVQIPSEDAQFQLQVGGPAGTELIKVIATTKADPLIAEKYLSEAGPVSEYRGTAKSLTRDITVELDPPEGAGERPESATFDIKLRILEQRAGMTPAGSTATEASAAAAGLTPDEMYRRGLAACFWGTGEPDYASAQAWFRRAAEKGHAKAMFRLGWLSENGFGIDRDARAARAWYRKAADQGHARAMTRLARLILDGQGGPADYALGRRWLERAAEAGDGAAMASLAEIYDQGLGVGPDAEIAAEMILGAVRGGHWRLQDHLPDFGMETRRIVQERLRVAGYYAGAIDGVIGPKTQAALVDYALAG